MWCHIDDPLKLAESIEEELQKFVLLLD